MKRSAFKRPTIARSPRVLPTPRPADWPRGVVVSAAGGSEAVPKDEPVRSEAYRRLVANLHCDRCYRPGPSQAAHSDSASDGKGMALKACDLSCYPLCPPCHVLVGGSGFLGKEGRREYEAEAAARTRLILIAAAMSDPKVRAVLVKVGLLP